MDKNFAIRNLTEVRDDLNTIIAELDASNDLKKLDGELYATVCDLYWKLNKVWNARRIDQKEIDNCNQKQSDLWCHFPTDIRQA